MPQGQPEFPRLPRVHAELKPQSFIPAAGQTQRPDPGVTRRHSDRHQHGAASRRRGRRGLGSGQRGVEGIGGRGRGGGGEGRGGRTRGRLRSSGALRHSTVTADNFAFHRRFSSYRCYCAVITLLSSTRTHTHTHVDLVILTPFTRTGSEARVSGFTSAPARTWLLGSCAFKPSLYRHQPPVPAVPRRRDGTMALGGDFMWPGASW